jgi:micrococcal nuclease
MRGEGSGENRSDGRWRAALAALLLWPLAGQVATAAPSDAARQAVTAILDGDTMALADGSRVRLAGIMAPKPPLGRPVEARWRMADEAKAALSALALARVVELRPSVADTDRYGRIVAQLYRDDGLWLQGELLRRGLARVASDVDDRALVPEMLAIERTARAARLGVWRDGFYAIRGAEEAGRFIESFQLVEGTIAEATKVKGQVFLNLGADWRSAFTIRIPRGALALFKEDGLDPLSWKIARVRVRGWIRLDRRPIIDVTHPEQIELLDAP